MKNNKFQYKASVGKIEGFFNVYQARNGKIYIQMGNLIDILSRA